MCLFFSMDRDGGSRPLIKTNGVANQVICWVINSYEVGSGILSGQSGLKNFQMDGVGVLVWNEKSWRLLLRLPGNFCSRTFQGIPQIAMIWLFLFCVNYSSSIFEHTLLILKVTPNYITSIEKNTNFSPMTIKNKFNYTKSNKRQTTYSQNYPRKEHFVAGIDRLNISNRKPAVHNFWKGEFLKTFVHEVGRYNFFGTLNTACLFLLETNFFGRISFKFQWC